MVFMWNARYFCPILTKFGVSRQIIVKSLQYQISRNFVDWHSCRCKRTGGQVDRWKAWLSRRSQLALLVVYASRTKNLTVWIISPQSSNVYTGCPGRNVPDFGGMFLKLKYTDVIQKHLYPKLNGYGDNGERSLKEWQLLHTYWLPNTY